MFLWARYFPLRLCSQQGRFMPALPLKDPPCSKKPRPIQYFTDITTKLKSMSPYSDLSASASIIDPLSAPP